jgi:hypothetical protein
LRLKEEVTEGIEGRFIILELIADQARNETGQCIGRVTMSCMDKDIEGLERGENLFNKRSAHHNLFINFIHETVFHTYLTYVIR